MSGQLVSSQAGRRGRIAPVVGTGLVALLAAGLVWVLDPHEGGYPPCPTAALLGIDCPACGGLRGMHLLLNGDVAGAADNNILLLVLIPILGFAWIGWLMNSWRGSSFAATQTTATRRLMVVVLVVVVLFGVVRNFVPYLGAGIG